MINHKTDKNAFSLEQRTEKSLIGKVLNFPKQVLATAGLLAALSGIGGCTFDARYSREIDPSDIQRSDRHMLVDYKSKEDRKSVV